MRRHKKIILVISVICLLFFGLRGVWATEVLGPPEAPKLTCKDQCPEGSIYRTIGKSGDKELCSYCVLVREEDKVYDCMCQGSNLVKNCHVGKFVSHPVCACCGDCTLTDVMRVGVNVANIILRYLGIIALVLFVIGGIMWITSGGAQEKVQRGKAMIVGAIVGMVIVLTAFLIVQAVMKSLGVKEEYLPKGEATSQTELLDISYF